MAFKAATTQDVHDIFSGISVIEPRERVKQAEQIANERGLTIFRTKFINKSFNRFQPH